MEYSKHESTFFEKEFEIIKSLGKGGYGEVFLCRNFVDKQEYAVKAIPISENGTKDSLLESEVLAKIEHPNVSRYYQSWIEGGIPTCLEKLVAEVKEEYGSSASSYEAPVRTLFISLKACSGTLRKKIGVLSPESIERVFKGLLCAIHHLHSMGIVHGDVKPENVLLDEDCNPKLIDFGSAFVVGGSAKEGGTLGYLLDGEQPSYSSDVYAFGLSMLEVICLITSTTMVAKRTDILQKIKASEEIPEELLEGADQIKHTVVRILKAASPSGRPEIAELAASVLAVESEALFWNRYHHHHKTYESNIIST